MITARQELDKFLDRRATVFYDAMMNMVRAHTGRGDLPEARKELADVIQRTLILSDLAGRRRVLMEADAAERKASARFSGIPETSPVVPGVVFEEAVNDMIEREPRLERSAAKISEMYSDQKVFAMAHSADVNLTERVQKIVQENMEKGGFFPDVEQKIMKVGEEQVKPFARAYADTVFRTNCSTAYTAGRFDQAHDEDVKEVIAGFRYEGISDAFTRENHRKGFGTIAPSDDPLWGHFRPPNGYNCRCTLEFVSRFEAERLGLWRDGKMVPHYTASPSELQPDQGFRTKAVTF